MHLISARVVTFITSGKRSSGGEIALTRPISLAALWSFEVVIIHGGCLCVCVCVCVCADEGEGNEGDEGDEGEGR